MPTNQRILVRGVNWLGDAVMTTPALSRLREARPDAHISLLTHAKLKDLWRDHPAINEVITFDDSDSAWTVSRKLSGNKFDVGLALPNSHRAALELRLAGIPQRIGSSRPWRNWLLTQVVPPHSGAVTMRKRSAAEINRLVGQSAPPTVFPATAHHIHQYLHLTAALGAKPGPLPPQLFVAPGQVAEFTAKFGLATNEPDAVWCGLNAGAEYGPAKRWPEARFIDTAVQVQRRTNCRWLIFGLKSDFAVCERIASGINSDSKQASKHAINLAGATNLAELCAALKLCRVLLTNDSGPMHVAAALSTPVVALFGSTSPELTGPGLPGDARHQLLRAGAPCSPCFLRECPIDFRCMTGLTVDRAVEAVLRVL
jgi:lipopolysaccharide heptosyltransferase II